MCPNVRGHKSPEKVEVTMKIVQGLLDANFMSEVKYIK